MAKKKQMKFRRKQYEFRPDNQQTNLIDQLYLTQKQRQMLLKWSLYAAVLLVLSVVQDTMLSKIHFWGATTDLVPGAILLICVLQGAESGSIFTLIASMLYVFSGTAPGAYSIALLTVLGVGAALFRQNFLRKGFSAAMLCTGVALVLYELLVFAVGLLMGQTIFSRLPVFMVSTALTFATVPLVYPAVVSIGKIGGETWKE